MFNILHVKNKENNVMLALITDHYVQLTHNSLRSLRENLYLVNIYWPKRHKKEKLSKLNRFCTGAKTNVFS